MIDFRLASDSRTIYTGNKGLSVLWLLAAGLWNPWTMDWLLGSGRLDAILLRIVAGLVAFSFLCWARWTWTHVGTPRTTKVHTSLVMVFLVLPLLGELGIRIGIESGVKELRVAGNYADPLGDDDYWKLKRLWGKQDPVAQYDPQIGWRSLSTKANPLGILRDLPYKPQSENVVAFFGDSFTAGVTPYGTRFPDRVDQQLDGWTAYNHGMGGYGVGQIYLRYLADSSKYQDPVVVVSIYGKDMDRSILSVRGRPKPAFREQDGVLIIEGQPVINGWKVWSRENPLELRSYLLGMLVRKLRLLAAGSSLSKLDYRREEKCRVNRAVIESLVADARRRKLRILFVVLPDRKGLIVPNWRTVFLGDLFEQLNVPWLDARALMVETARTKKCYPSSFFLKSDGHPNKDGNQIIGNAIAGRLNELWNVPLKSSGSQSPTEDT